MRSSLALWIFALLLTLFSAAWQRRTGPTHPISGRTPLEGRTIEWTFERTHKGAGDHVVRLRAPGDVTGELEWRKFGVTMDPVAVPMARQGDELVAMLPWQPPAGVLKYRVRLTAGSAAVTIPGSDPVTIRYTGEVPAYVLAPHILLMILSMLVSARTGLECFAKSPRLEIFTHWTLGILTVGGMILGPLVLKHAFGFWWTGWPVGTDITDNKTLVALVGWIVAAIAVHRAAKPAPWVLAASILMFLVFMIPHSYRGTGFEEPEAARTSLSAPADRGIVATAIPTR